MLCNYGCLQESKYTVTAAQVGCCSKKYQGCPAYRSRMSRAKKLQYKFTVRAQDLATKCKTCNEIFTRATVSVHERFCYLNPTNIKPCPVCASPIRNYKSSTTCSYGCANTYFRSNRDSPKWKGEAAKNYYIKECFRIYTKKCAVCEEFRVVAVHHLDEDHSNNDIANLIPLCPTHHQYMHSRYKNLISDKISCYKQNALLKYEKKLNGV